MSSTNRIIGDYNLTNKDIFGANITISTHTLIIDGNLLVGNITNATITNTSVEDNIITLNRGERGTGVSLNYAGIEIDRGPTTANVSLRWNEPYKLWQVTNDGVTFANIASSSSGSALGNVYADPSPTLGGNLNLLGRTIYDSSTGNVSANISNVGTGGTGIHSKTYLGTHELIQKRMALIYNTLL